MSKGEDPRRKDCQIICRAAVYDIFDWGYVYILYGNFSIVQWCPFYIRMETETVCYVTPASVPVPPLICSAMFSDEKEVKKPSQKDEELVGPDPMAIENLEEEEVIMAEPPPVNVIDNIDIVEENQSQGGRCWRGGSKSSFGSVSMGTIIIIVACFSLISPASATYHGKFLTRTDYLRDCTQFTLMTDFDKAAYWIAFKSIIMFRSYMQLDSVRRVKIPDVPKVFCQFLRCLRLDAICKIHGGTVESLYITRQIMERC